MGGSCCLVCPGRVCAWACGTRHLDLQPKDNARPPPLSPTIRPPCLTVATSHHHRPPTIHKHQTYRAQSDRRELGTQSNTATDRRTQQIQEKEEKQTQTAVHHAHDSPGETAQLGTMTAQQPSLSTPGGISDPALITYAAALRSSQDKIVDGLPADRMPTDSSTSCRMSSRPSVSQTLSISRRSSSWAASPAERVQCWRTSWGETCELPPPSSCRPCGLTAAPFSVLTCRLLPPPTACLEVPAS